MGKRVRHGRPLGVRATRECWPMGSLVRASVTDLTDRRSRRKPAGRNQKEGLRGSPPWSRRGNTLSAVGGGPNRESAQRARGGRKVLGSEASCKDDAGSSSRSSPCSPNPLLQGYHEYIDENLPPESPYLYGLHPNAEIGFLTVTSEKLFRTVLEMQPKETDSGAGTGVSREEKVGV